MALLTVSDLKKQYGSDPHPRLRKLGHWATGLALCGGLNAMLAGALSIKNLGNPDWPNEMAALLGMAFFGGGDGCPVSPVHQ